MDICKQKSLLIVQFFVTVQSPSSSNSAVTAIGMRHRPALLGQTCVLSPERTAGTRFPSAPFFFFFFHYSTGELREGWLVLSTNCWSDTVKLISISRTVRRARAGVSERTSRPCCISVSLFFYIFFLISISLLPLGKAIARYICKLFSVEATRAVGLVYSFYLSFGFSGVATDFRSKPHTQRL